MPRHRDLAPVGADYAMNGPNHNTLHRSIPASSDELFRCLEDGEATKEWQGLDVEWTSRPPGGIGGTRTLKGLGQTIEQSVLAWEPGRRMCFRNDRTTLPLAAFAEDYLIAPTTDSTCELRWHYAFEWGGPAKPVLGRLFGLAFAIGGRRDLEKTGESPRVGRRTRLSDACRARPTLRDLAMWAKEFQIFANRSVYHPVQGGMTLTTTKPNNINTPNESEVGKPKRTALLIAAALSLLVAAAGFWYFLVREVAPAEVDSVEAAAARSAAAAEVDAADTPATDGISGTWNVDTSIGEFNEGCLTEVCSSTFAGFRIDEVLSGIGDKTVVGRTPGVEGQILVDGTVVTGGRFVVDMTGLITDSGARTNALRSQSIETEAFPTATFELTAPLDFGRIPGGGEQVTVSAAGNLTVHGVTQAVEMPLTAELQNGLIVVFGQLELALADYGIDAPSAPVVVSVEDTAILELQLFLTR